MPNPGDVIMVQKSINSPLTVSCQMFRPTGRNDPKPLPRADVLRQVLRLCPPPGHASDFFLLERGVRQGCSLSGLLFVIGIELLSGALQKDPTIRGIQVGQKEIKIMQYADDTMVLVRDLDSVSQLLKFLNSFKNISGLEVIKQKTD